MNFGTFKTTFAAWVHRDDLTTYIPDFANIALHQLEDMDLIPGKSWRYMEYRATSTVAAGQSTITFPTSIKSVRYLRVYDTANKYYPVPMVPVSIEQIATMYPDSVNITGEPKFYAWQQYTGEFVVAPTLDRAYTAEIVCYKYTTDMSSDTDTNWWLTNHWEVLLYGALIAAEPFIINDARLATWKGQYAMSIQTLRQLEINREYATGPLNIGYVSGA